MIEMTKHWALIPIKPGLFQLLFSASEKGETCSHLAVYGNTFHHHNENTRRGWYRCLLNRERDVAKHLSVYKTVSHNKELSHPQC